MRKHLLLLLSAALAACSGGERRSARDQLSLSPYSVLAVKLSSAPGRPAVRKVAVLPFSYADKRSSEDGMIVAERLLTQLTQLNKFELVERSLLEKVMGELKLQNSGAMDGASIKNLGKVLGVDAVVTGTLMPRSDGQMEINARMIKADDALILSAAAVLAPQDWEASRPALPGGEAAPGSPRAEPPSRDADFPKAWRYRDNFRVAEKSGKPLSDHQVRFALDTSAAVRGGRMKPDCSDIRFANSDGTSPLNFWLEGGCGTADTRVWVRLPFLAKRSVKNVYMYYGNPSAAPASSGEKTFLFFDDFSGDVLDKAKWTVLRGACPVGHSLGRLEFVGCSLGSETAQTALLQNSPVPAPYAVEFDAAAQDGGDNGMWHEVHLRWDGETAGAYRTPKSAVSVTLFDGFSAASDNVLAGRAAINTYVEGHTDFPLRSASGPLTSGVLRHFKVTDDGSRISVSQDGREMISSSNGLSSGDRIGLSAREYPRGIKAYYDNVFVRRLAEEEPETYLYRRDPGV